MGILRGGDTSGDHWGTFWRPALRTLFFKALTTLNNTRLICNNGSINWKHLLRLLSAVKRRRTPRWISNEKQVRLQ